MKTCHLFRHLLPVLLFLPFIVRADSGGNDGPIVSNVPLNEIHVRAYRYFHKAWPAIGDEAWYKTDKEYIVSFRSNSHLKKAYFNLRGVFLYSLEYYAGKDAAAGLSGMVLKKFPDYQIDIVTEVSNGTRTVHYLTIKNGSCIKTISIIDGKMDVNDSFAGN
jgi:hypothetical protein